MGREGGEEEEEGGEAEAEEEEEKKKMKKKKMEKEKETEKKKKKQGEKEVFQFYIYKLPIDRPAAVTGIIQGGQFLRLDAPCSLSILYKVTSSRGWIALFPWFWPH